ncbi:hypothetical protein ACPF31_002654 [Vibrio cholerae]|uniref:hypothetical protein n=1 Tax=Vibrio cholerae TaxID=666 RepID=UPI000376C42F|nr:hypothetical protein [Vibrio cholerae]EGQ7978605.1 hypothetical protein [Vibrio cholerae]EGQ8394294.1 hypothetical protein [Vibrio cholerae]EGQ8529759.1 hypothetical protein [Vibrio cholerae]EGQ8558941.1 hypothetical protein [Vibrio cholerae]EGR2589499.1 hypothetical protein [Vibrio cholerae]
MKKHRASRVFVPGGMPELTYIERAESSIKESLNKAQDNLCKLVTLTGQTKSGKTVLTQRVFPEFEDHNIWINGGSIQSENDIWEQVLDALDGWTNTEVTDTDGSASALKSSGKGKGSVGFASIDAQIGAERTESSSSSSKSSRAMSSKSAALRALRESGCALIIDDFHYFERDLQGKFVRAVKPLVFHGLPVILIAIPHRRYDAIKVEREITGRIENVTMPYWEKDELKQIPETGFPLLNVTTSLEVVDKLAEESMGSPHLMQEFCRQLCLAHNVEETLDEPLFIGDFEDSLFKSVGESTGKIIFDKLSTGPRQRSDRLQRTLTNNEQVDIYKVVLLALARLKPEMQTVTYEELRTAIREILKDSVPQAHEVTRVLEKMSEIASSDEASTPVIDWEKDEQKLHITDPFFAFYLKWGAPQV